ncbi:MAG: hypothetical protein ACOYNI_11615 [Acidimicrobiia bacterium]
MTTPVHALIRVWLPDRPGALGLVASRIGAARGDIVGVDVLESGDGIVVDEFAVELADESLVATLVREVEQVDGASVEQVRVVSDFPDARLDALDTAARLCEAADAHELCATLTQTLRREFLADWVALVADGAVVALAGETTTPDLIPVWAAGASASPLVANGTTGPEDLAIATFERRDAVLVVGREGQPFRRRERLQLLALARVADRAWALLAPAPGSGPA